MGNTPISVLLANLSDIYLAGISHFLSKVDCSPFQIVASTSLDSLVQLVREFRPHLLLVGLPRKGVDVTSTIMGRTEETIAEIRNQFPEVIIAVFAVPGVEEYREALAISKRAGVEANLSLELKGEKLVSCLKQLFAQRAEAYKQRLQDLPTGDGRGYESFCEEVIPFLFKPYFTRFEWQLRRGTGDQPDLVCKNQGGHRFCEIIRQDHDARYVVFEFKNEATPTRDHWRQLASCLKPATGRFGILLVRKQPKRQRELYVHLGSLFATRNIMLIPLYDQDVLAMLDMRIRLLEPMDYLEQRYDYYRMHI